MRRLDLAERRTARPQIVLRLNRLDGDKAVASFAVFILGIAFSAKTWYKEYFKDIKVSYRTI